MNKIHVIYENVKNYWTNIEEYCPLEYIILYLQRQYNMLLKIIFLNSKCNNHIIYTYKFLFIGGSRGTLKWIESKQIWTCIAHLVPCHRYCSSGSRSKDFPNNYRSENLPGRIFMEAGIQIFKNLIFSQTATLLRM